MLHSAWRAGRWPLAITLMAAALAACSDMPTATPPLDEPGAPRDVQATVDEAARVYFLIDDRAVIDRETGRVRVSGMVGCSSPAKFDIGVSLLMEQKRGLPVVVESTAVPQIECTTAYAPWSVGFESAKGLHHNGTAIISVRAEAPATPIVPAGLTQTVNLIREGR